MAAGEQSLDHFATITCLTSKPNHEEALRILRRVATMVRPIMKAHNWKTQILAEFYPKNLLGMNTNRGWKIQLCLRHHDDVSRFLPWEDILGTMLHELAHNIRGPHDAQFYKAMNDLNDEYDKIIASGYTGVGFDAAGQRLGGRGLGGEARGSREAAILAAERRRRVNEMMLPAGGRKLGGSAGSSQDPTSKGFWEKWHSPGELAALAAEQRAKDQLWCGSVETDGGESSTQVVPTETQVEPENRQLENRTLESAVSEASRSINVKAAEAAKRRLASDSSRDTGEGSKKIKRHPISTSTNTSTNNRAQSTTTQPSRTTLAATATPTTTSGTEWFEWSCPTCTLLNKPLALQCDCCLSERPLL